MSYSRQEDIICAFGVKGDMLGAKVFYYH